MGGRRIYDDEQRAHAIGIALAEGLGPAARATGIHRQTIHGWLSEDQRDELRRLRRKTAEANEAHLIAVATERLALAEGLLGDIELLREELFAPCVERQVVTVSDGRDRGSHAEIVDVELAQPNFRDQQRIMTSIAIAVDKVQVLTGQPTSRIDVTGDARDRAAGMIDELARRRDAKAS